MHFSISDYRNTNDVRAVFDGLQLITNGNISYGVVMVGIARKFEKWFLA